VRQLLNVPQDAGFQKITWNGLNDAGLAVSSGVYFVRMIAAKQKFVRRLSLQK